MFREVIRRSPLNHKLSKVVDEYLTDGVFALGCHINLGYLFNVVNYELMVPRFRRIPTATLIV